MSAWNIPQVNLARSRGRDAEAEAEAEVAVIAGAAAVTDEKAGMTGASSAGNADTLPTNVPNGEIATAGMCAKSFGF